jgi:hypothetical protein
MSIKPGPATIPPEIKLAFIHMRGFPPYDQITVKYLSDYINKEYPAEVELYLQCNAATLELMVADGYVAKEPGDTLSGGLPKYGLTQEGRELKSGKGYIQAYLEKKKNKDFTKKVLKNEGERKIWDNRSKYFVFGFSALGVLVVFLGLLANHRSAAGADKSPAQAVPAVADSGAGVKPSKKDPSALSPRKHHSKPAVSEIPAVSGNPGNGTSTSRSPAPTTDQKPQTVATLPPPRPAEPLQSTTTDNIEFKLLKAEGNTRSQSITMTLVLTTSAANHRIDADVRSIIDNDGNEYNRKSFSIGSNTITSEVDLTTGVPLRCTYTFGGILPDVKRIKLFNYTYYHTGGTFHVEFRDIPIDWR